LLVEYADDNLQEAGIPRKLAPTIGIAVDPRRQNLSEESLAANVERLKAYKARLVLFPRKIKSPKAGEASAEDVKELREKNHDGKVKVTGEMFPISNKVTIEEGNVADFESEEAAYRKLRIARSDARLVGKREKRAKAKEEEAAAQKK
jgi:large subunit ribosomal protein L13e